ncbi:MAG: 2-hydroxyacid dehydrogenase [Anaerolineaceae bacterium]
MLPNLVVTYRASQPERNLFQKTLGGSTNLIFSADLPPAEEDLALQQAEIVLSWGLPREKIKGMKNVRFWQSLAAGVDNLPFDLLAPSVPVAANIGAYAEPMAEHVLALALALAKRLRPSHLQLENQHFDQFAGGNLMLRDGIAAILGFGGIGKETARLLRSLRMKIYAINRSGKTDQPVDFIGTLEGDLEKVLRAAQLVVITLPHTRSTDGLIGARELGWMRDDAILINVARGPILQQAALYEHLVSHPKFTAGLDVWWTEPFSKEPLILKYPFLDLPNVIGTPHNSAMAGDSMLVGARRAAENVRHYLNGEPLRGLVRREDYLD